MIVVAGVFADPRAAALRRAILELELEAAEVRRASELEHAIRSRAAQLAIVGGELDEELVTRLARRCPATTVVVWLSSPSTERAADYLAAGAVDVLDPTMGDRELTARLRRALSRHAIDVRSALSVGGLEIDLYTGSVTWEGEPLALTAREREVLDALARADGRTVRREVLYRQVWGYTMARGDRSVDVNVKRLRDKLASAGVTLEIKTEAGVGYRLDLASVADSVTAP